MSNKNILGVVVLVLVIGGILYFNSKKAEVVVAPEVVTLTEEQMVNGTISKVDAFIKANIQTLATNKPVLGGSWSVVKVDVNTETNTGMVVYEDGHIENKATFSFMFDSNDGTALIKDFVVVK